MDGGFKHTEEPYNAMRDRLHFIQEHVRRPLSEERKKQLMHEMSCIAFELFMREQETGLD